VKIGDHVRIRAAKLTQAVGCIGRIIDDGHVRLTPPLRIQTGATIHAIWCDDDDIEVIEPTARYRLIMQTVEDLASAFLYYDRKEDDRLPVFSIQDAVSAGEVTVDEIVDRLRAKLDQAVARRRGDR
jgi:hypothetical protein